MAEISPLIGGGKKLPKYVAVWKPVKKGVWPKLGKKWGTK